MTLPLNAKLLVNRLRYKHLHMLVTLGNCQNLHRAAEALNMSQPATSRMLQDIEETFGCSLFERQARGVKPTLLGDELVRFARSALNGLERCAEDLLERQAGGYGFLAVGAIMGAVPDLVIQAIATIKARQPLLKLRVMGDTSDQLIELLEQRRIDVAIARMSASTDRHQYEFRPIANERLIAVVRKGHPLVSQKKSSLKMLIEEWSWILQPDTSPARVALEQFFTGRGLSSPLDVIECSSVFAMLQLARVTDSILVLPDSLVRDYLAAGLLVLLDIELQANMSPFGILLRRNEPISFELQGFLEVLDERVRHLAPEDSAKLT